MKNWVGFLLKHYRLKLNFSQSGVCKGICTVSYLSKIENGTAQPSEEVIEQLFKALGIKSCWNKAVLKQGEKLLTAYFDQVFHNEDTSESSEADVYKRQDQYPMRMFLIFIPNQLHGLHF